MADRGNIPVTGDYIIGLVLRVMSHDDGSSEIPVAVAGWNMRM